jgi:uncharacterized repeat protein (TIGR02543 family)
MRKFLIFIMATLLLFASNVVFSIVQVGEEVAQRFETPHPYPGVKGVVWEKEFHWPNAGYIAVHFSEFDLAKGDYVEISSPDGRFHYTFSEKGKKVKHRDRTEELSEFWGTHIPGDRAIVRLVSKNKKSGHGFVIDKWARGYEAGYIEAVMAGLEEEAMLEAVCNSDDKEWAKCYEGTTMYDESRAVCRLLIGGTSACTGWLLGSEGHVMTNNHCISTQSSAGNTDYEFMAEGATCSTSCASWGACPGIVEASSGSLIQTDSSLDYTLILLPTNITGTYGYMQLRDTLPSLDERIYIPQHPGAWGKQLAVVSDTDGPYAKIYSTNETPCSGGPGDIGYYADTAGGSSGSPVLAYNDHLVVALHHCANCPNRGVPIPPIITDLGSNLPANAVGGVIPPNPPVANFTAGSTTISEGQNVTFTDTSTNNPTSWSWSFEGGSPSGSSSQNPTVTYNTAGTYDVSLTAGNSAGSDTETKTNYITVTEAMPTVGNTSVFGSTSTSAYRRAMPFTMPENGTITSVTMYHAGGSGSMILAVYDGEGTPQNRLGVTAVTAVSGSTGWQTINLTGSANVAAGTTVWLAWVYESNPGIAYQTGSPGRYQSGDTWSGGMPDPFGSGSQSNYLYSIYASYTTCILPCTLTVNTVGQGSVALNPPGGTYDPGTVVTLTATPYSGWQFDGWSGDLTGTANPAAITMNSNKSVTANFSEDGFGIVGNTSVFGSISTSAYRRAMPFTMPENGFINSVSMYHVGGSGSMILGVYEGEGTPQNRLGVTAVTALSSSTGWQTINLTSPAYVFVGTTVWLAWVYESNPGIAYQTGSPGRYQSTLQWSGGMPDPFGSGSQASYLYSIYATYTPGPIEYILTTNTVGSGSITANPEGPLYLQGTVVTLTATPDLGWEFDYWSGDLSGTVNPTTITMNSNKNVTATFSGGGIGTVGNAVVFGSTSVSAYRRAMPFTMPEDGTITSVTMYHTGGSGSMILAVYDGEGTPQARLSVTPTTAVSGNTGWQTINLTSPVSVQGGTTVWLAWVYETNPGIRYQTGSPGRYQSTLQWSGGMPDPFGSGSQTTYIYSIYGTYYK